MGPHQIALRTFQLARSIVVFVYHSNSCVRLVASIQDVVLSSGMLEVFLRHSQVTGSRASPRAGVHYTSHQPIGLRRTRVQLSPECDKVHVHSSDMPANLILGLIHVSREVRQAKRDEWFRSLPPDRLSHEEVHLQMALNEFMEQWTNSRAPTTTEALQIHSIRAARSACLPRQISLANWIQHRLGHIWQIEEGGGIARKRGIDAVQ